MHHFAQDIKGEFHLNQTFDIREFSLHHMSRNSFPGESSKQSHLCDNLPDLVLLLPVEVPDELLEAALALSDEEADPDPAMTSGLLAEIHKTSVI